MMAMSASSSRSTREAALARRKALSIRGKSGLEEQVRRSPSTSRRQTAKALETNVAMAANGGMTARSVARLRRQAMSRHGKAGIVGDQRRDDETSEPRSVTENTHGRKNGSCNCGCKKVTESDQKTDDNKKAERQIGELQLRLQKLRHVNRQDTRATALARRRALSTRGKAGLDAGGMSVAQTTRAVHPNLSGRDLARAVRAQRSRNGKTGSKRSERCPPSRPPRPSARSTEDVPSKVGVSETTRGQIVTGTVVGRSKKVTGDEPSTCRVITGTEYMGADIFHDFCQIRPDAGPHKVALTPTTRGVKVTGNEVGRSAKVTGDEPGTCKHITGTEYVGVRQYRDFCDLTPDPGPSKVSVTATTKGRPVTGTNVDRSPRVTGNEYGADRVPTGTQYMKPGNGKAPPKVGATVTLRGGTVTGTVVGRSSRVTGDEPGSCKIITGDEYIGQEQYNGFCSKVPEPQDAKVRHSKTFDGQVVSGTIAGRSTKVTGDEPGACKAITGTPYAGAEQYLTHCRTEDAELAAARARTVRSTPGAVLTGQQPGINGKMTGAEKGACEPVSGTPYIGADQYAESCPADVATPGSLDFPQILSGTPWGSFSVTSPAHAALHANNATSVTGTRYEQGRITGSFSKAGGMVTGTEESRFGPRERRNGEAETGNPQDAPVVGGRVKSRITGEGIDAGPRITGDDWERGDRVTGTEGSSAMRRNPTRRGAPTSAMPYEPAKRNQDLPEPISRVTGGSGNTEQGALVTYSGGARG